MNGWYSEQGDYVSPELNVIELAIEGVLCESYEVDEGEWWY